MWRSVHAGSWESCKGKRHALSSTVSSKSWGIGGSRTEARSTLRHITATCRCTNSLLSDVQILILCGCRKGKGARSFLIGHFFYERNRNSPTGAGSQMLRSCSAQPIVPHSWPSPSSFIPEPTHHTSRTHPGICFTSSLLRPCRKKSARVEPCSLTACFLHKPACRQTRNDCRARETGKTRGISTTFSVVDKMVCAIGSQTSLFATTADSGALRRYCARGCAISGMHTRLAFHTFFDTPADEIDYVAR